MGEITTRYGQVGTNNPQETRDIIRTGKNLNKKNSTTAFQQAVLEAQAKHEQQRKKGYVASKKAAIAGELDKIIKGGVQPMLAHTYAKNGHKINFPCTGQPKLDGVRCIAVIKNGKCTLWSRTRKPINSVPHIIHELEKLFAGQTITLDGELYNHDYHDNFEDLIDIIRADEPQENHSIIQYHVYDLVNLDKPCSQRLLELSSFLETEKASRIAPSLQRVVPRTLDSQDDIEKYHNECREANYEGCMVRNIDSKYENKRSYNLQKVKIMQDAEFPIVGFQEGRGKLQGHIGKFLCTTPEGKEFGAKLRGKLSRLKEYFDDHTLWKGKQLTVTFQAYTKDGIPRFPVGKAIRDYD